MQTTYRSAHTVESLARGENGVSTAALEEAVLRPFQDSGYLKRLDQTRESLAELEMRLRQVGLDQEGWQGALMQFLHWTGLYTVQQRRRKKAKRVARQVRTIERNMEQYEQELGKQQNAIERAVDLREKAGVLMERYDHTIGEMEERITQLTEFYGEAKETAIVDGRSNGYLSIQNDISNIRLDIAKLKAKCNRAAMKVVQFQRTITYAEQIKNRVELLYQKCNDTFLRGEEALGYYQLTEGNAQLNAAGTFRCILDTEQGLMGLRETAMEVDRALLDITQHIQGFEAADWQPDQEDGFAAVVKEGNDRYVQLAREILAKGAVPIKRVTQPQPVPSPHADTEPVRIRSRRMLGPGLPIHPVGTS